MYVYYGTNEYNFEKLENPPEYEPTTCSKCGTVIVLSGGGYSTRGDEYFCEECTHEDFSKMVREKKQKN
jgi:transposase